MVNTRIDLQSLLVDREDWDAGTIQKLREALAEGASPCGTLRGVVGLLTKKVESASPATAKVLLPLLEDQYGRVLEAGKIRLGYQEGSFFIGYHQTRLPVSPGTYPAILEGPLAQLASALEDGHHPLRELRSILTALNYLPARTKLAADNIIERHREKEVIKQRLAASTVGTGGAGPWFVLGVAVRAGRTWS